MVAGKGGGGGGGEGGAEVAISSNEGYCMMMGGKHAQEQSWERIGEELELF